MQFIVAAAVVVVALIPLSKMIGDSTENLSLYYGMTIGSLLMVTLGNFRDYSWSSLYQSRSFRPC
jgi:Ca2+/H+ antiporter